jgi:glutamyl-tRNA synthetase
VPLSPEILARARRLALENAIAHGGIPRAGPIVARLLGTDPTLRREAPAVQTAVEATIQEVASLSPDAREAALAALGGAEASTPRPIASEEGTFPDLLGAVRGKVVLRMAPFPSGSLHIGNARMLFVNEYYRRKYDGRLLLVFDDTVGSEEKRVDLEAFDLILGDLELAGVHPDAVYYKSDRIAKFYPWARRVIERGGAYVCICPSETLRENREAGRACAERLQTVDQTLELWERMLSGGFAQGEAVLRLRTDIADPDPAFRDRVLFRINEQEHPRVGHKYRVWPLLEFSWAADDVELGVTHVLRGKDLVMEDRMQEFIWRLLEIQGPPFLHWGLLRVREAKISKSKSYQEVKSGLYDGWADPRTWSLRSLDRRGISMDACRRFTLSFGMSLSDIEVPAETLYAENRKLIDPTTPRRAFVADPIRVDVEGYPDDLGTVELPNHPDRAELGVRTVPAGPSFYLARADVASRVGMEVRLKELVNLQLPAELPADASSISARFTSRENRRVPRLQWIGAEGATPVDLLETDGTHRAGIGERALLQAAPRDIVQFERVGFVRFESNWPAGSSPVRVVFAHG